MTTTPTVWKPAFTANLGATNGTQTVPQAIGLKNGNILVVWEDTTNGPGPSVDVMGQLFDARGNRIGNPFQVNTDVVASDETGPKIVALPDGGYVIAYGSFSQAIGGFIGIERHAADGSLRFSDIITDPNSSLNNWELVTDPAGNYTIVYERQKFLGNVDIFSITYNQANNARGPERNAAQNSGEDDVLGGVAAFANGHIITLTNEPDFDIIGRGSQTTEFTIVNPATGIVRGPVEIAGRSDVTLGYSALAEDVAVLTSGQFVTLYRVRGFPDGFDGLWFNISPSENGDIGGDFFATFDVSLQLTGDILALKDGGFFITFYNDVSNQLLGRRYSSSGAAIGDNLIIASDVPADGFNASRMSLTDDGRILVPFRNGAGDISLAILDPRETIIRGTGADEVITGQLAGTQLFGEGGSDTLIGRENVDDLDGGPGADTLEGGGGNDFYVLRDVALRPNFIVGFDAVVERPNEGIDTVVVQRVGSIGSYFLPDNVENGIVAGFNPTTDTFSLFGNELRNELTGNAAANTLSGAGGDDRLIGNQGNDTIEGGEGFDTAVFSGVRSAYQLIQNGSTLTVIGPDGTDTLTSIERLWFDDLILSPNAPTITSNGGGTGATVAIQENSTAVTTVVATDPDPETTLTYSISGGADAALFQINSATGVLSFKSAPNFEQPADADRNNSYLVTVRAFDGGLFDDQAITAIVTDVSERPRWLASVDIGPHPAGWLPVSTDDFNNDGTSDVLWFNNATHHTDLWKIANGGWAGSVDIGTHPPGYQASLSGDFNGDGTSDLLWYSPGNGHVDIWKIANGQWAGSADVGLHPTGWQPAGSGDFNADGIDDVLWYNPTTGRTEIWKLVNAQWSGSVDVGAHPLGWQPVGTGDFNGDGTSDVLWYNPATGHVDLWKLANGQWAGSADIGTHPLGWTPAGIGDFNTDGTSDVAWFNASTGQLEVWLIANGQWSASVSIGAHPLGWSPEGVGDFNNDDVSDILWRETSTNRTETWLLTVA